MNREQALRELKFGIGTYIQYKIGVIQKEAKEKGLPPLTEDLQKKIHQEAVKLIQEHLDEVIPDTFISDLMIAAITAQIIMKKAETQKDIPGSENVIYNGLIKNFIKKN